MIRILHVIQGLYPGGGLRALLGAAKYSSHFGDYHHRILSLKSPDSKQADLVNSYGFDFTVFDNSNYSFEINNSDIVQFHFWNNPEIYNFLNLQLPPMRSIAWYHIHGGSLPQVITNQLTSYFDYNIPTAEISKSDLESFKGIKNKEKNSRVITIPGGADFERLKNFISKTHDNFNVSYIGTVDYVKMHPEFVKLHDGINIGDLNILIAGFGDDSDLRNDIKISSRKESYNLLGYREDISSILEISDVFGYPLNPDTYATGELVLQEAMFAAVPPVVFPVCNLKNLVINDETGLVVNSNNEYAQAIEYLYRNPNERRRIGENARTYATQHYGAENTARNLSEIYSQAMKLPKRLHPSGFFESRLAVGELLSAPELTQDIKGNGALRFLQSLGDLGKHFHVSLFGSEIDDIIQSEARIALSPPVLQSSGGGGILHYCSYYKNDPVLLLWAGLVEFGNKNYAQATQYFASSVKCGYNHWRIVLYLSIAAEKDGNHEAKRQFEGNIRAQLISQNIDYDDLYQNFKQILEQDIYIKNNLMFSVISPTYNQAKYIEKTISSVLEQNYSNFEHIVIDGSSSDGTIEILKKHKHLNWLSEPDSGQTEALNKGLREAKGEIIAWINSDDYYAPETFRTVADYFSNHPDAMVVHGNSLLFNDINEKVIPLNHAEYDFEEILQYWWGESMPSQPSVFFKRELIDEFGYFDESLRYAMDYEYWCRISRKYKFHHVNKLFSYYRLHAESKSGESLNWSQFYPEWDKVFQRYKKYSKVSPNKRLLSVVIVVNSALLDNSEQTVNLRNYLHYLETQRFKDLELLVFTDLDRFENIGLLNNITMQTRVVRFESLTRSEFIQGIYIHCDAWMLHCADTNKMLDPDWYCRQIHNAINMRDKYNVIMDNSFGTISHPFLKEGDILSSDKIVRLEKLREILQTQIPEKVQSEYLSRNDNYESEEFDFSLIIPTHNRSDILKLCLDSISKQTYSHNLFEVIVIDDGSNDNTEELLRSYKSSFKLRYYKQSNSGPATARNLGIKQAMGKYLLILNDDAILAADLIQKHYEHQENHNGRYAILGTFDYLEEYNKNFFVDLVVKSNTTFLFYTMLDGKEYDYRYFWTCNISILRQAVVMAGLFDESFKDPMAEDIELGLRLERLGYKVLHKKDCVAIHHHTITLKGFCRRQEMWGKNAFKLMQKYPVKENPEMEKLGFVEIMERDYEAFMHVEKERIAQIEKILSVFEGFQNYDIETIKNSPIAKSFSSIEAFREEATSTLSIINNYFFFKGLFESYYKSLNDESDLEKKSQNSVRIIFSIIIPTYQRADILQKCLEALNQQDFPMNRFEVIVIDDGSRDTTKEIVNSFKAKYQLEYIYQPNSGPAAARNKGILKAEGEYILILNDDAIAARDLLSVHYKNQNEINGKKLAVLGDFEFIKSEQSKPFVYFLTKSPFVFAYPIMKSGGIYPYRFFWTCNISIHRSAFEEVGLFDEDFREAMGEDTELGWRLEKAGWQVLYTPEAFCSHDHSMNIYDLLSRQRKNGRNMLLLFHKHPEILIKEKELFGFSELNLERLKEFVTYIKQNKALAEKEIEIINNLDSIPLQELILKAKESGQALDENQIVRFIESKIEIIHKVYFNEGILEGAEKYGLPLNKAKISKGGKKSGKLRILMTMYGWNESGGGTTLPKAVAARLVKHGHQVCVFYAGMRHKEISTPYFIEKSIDDGVELIGIFNRATDFLDSENPLREVYDERITAAFSNILNDFQADIIHFNNFLGLSFGLAEIAAAKNTATVFTPHNYHLIDPNLYMFKNDLTGWSNTSIFENSNLAGINDDKFNEYKLRIVAAKDLLNNKIDRTFAISSRVKSMLVEFGAESSKIDVINQVPESCESLAGYRKTQADLSYPIRFGFIGAVLPHKGVHNIIIASQAFDPDKAQFSIYGFGSEEYINMMKSMDKKRIVKWCGSYNHTDLKAIANEVDVMLVPSIWEEGAGMVIPESFAMGIPVIAANIGGIPDYIEDGINGRLYQADSVKSLAGVISEILQKPDLIKIWSTNAKLRYSFDEFVAHLEKSYLKIINGDDSDTCELMFRN